MLTVLLATSIATGGPCDLATSVEAERSLKGPVVDVPADQIGEETAPMCLWATAGRAAEIKISIWSVDELPVLGLPDAESYFVRREAEARAESGFAVVDGLGARAFQSGFIGSTGTVTVLKGSRVVEFEFVGVAFADARAFVSLVNGRL